MMKSGVAAGPAMAAYEESATFQTAIHRRLYKAMATELRLIHARMRQIKGGAPIQYGTSGQLHQGDLLMVDILPAMRPGEASKQKAILEAQALWDMSKEAPDVIDKRKAAIKLLRALNEPNLDDLLLPDPDEEQPEPMDAISEYGMLLQGNALKAGLMQNHQAHIDTHSVQMKMLGTSELPVEQGSAAMASLAAHIAEHMAQQQLVTVAARLGIPVQMFMNGIPPELEAELAPQIAVAIQTLEQERAAMQPDAGGGDDKLAVEQMRQQGKLQETGMKQRHDREMAELKHRQARELQQQKDVAQMAREEADNEAALEIAAMRGGTSSNASAGARSSAGAGAGARANATAGGGETR
jgi:hypothetical protein